MKHIETLLPFYLTDELDERQKEKVKKHCALCASCAKNLEALIKGQELLSVLKEEKASPWLSARTMSMIYAEVEREGQKVSWKVRLRLFWLPMARPAYAAMIFIFAFLSMVLFSHLWTPSKEIARMVAQSENQSSIKPKEIARLPRQPYPAVPDDLLKQKQIIRIQPEAVKKEELKPVPEVRIVQNEPAIKNPANPPVIYLEPLPFVRITPIQMGAPVYQAAHPNPVSSPSKNIGSASVRPPKTEVPAVRETQTDIQKKLGKQHSRILNNVLKSGGSEKASLIYQLDQSTRVTIVVLNHKGHRVNTLVDEDKNRGYFEVVWAGTNKDGLSLASGVYYVTILTNHFKETRKILILR